VSKKKNKTEVMPPALADPPAESPEAPPPASVEPPGELPALESSASASSSPSLLSPAEPELKPPEPTPAFLEDGPHLDPSPPEPVREKPAADLVLTNAPFAIPAPEFAVGALAERITRLEEAFAQLQNLQGIEQRVAQSVASQLQREKPAPAPPPPAEPSPLATAAALLDASKRLLPVTVPTVVAGSPVPRKEATPAHPWWLVWDAVAEARAIVRMYLDPRYTLSWMGRTVPLILLGAFLTTQWWVPFAGLWFPAKAAEVVIGFLLFKVLSHEARRYRETAPDLPPNLRL
jgi:hypothetical protein